MNSSTFLQIFLLINVFIIGAFTTIALQHAIAHFRPKKRVVEKPHPHASVINLPPEIKEQLLHKSQENFQAVLDHTAVELQNDLSNTAIRLNEKLDKLGNKIIDDEMERYHANLDQLRKQAEDTISIAQNDINEHQTDLKTKLTNRQAELEAEMIEKVKAEQQLLVQNMETKLGDAIASFLSETLQHNVDLGAQSAYLTSMLEEHKAEIIKGLSNEN